MPIEIINCRYITKESLINCPEYSIDGMYGDSWYLIEGTPYIFKFAKSIAGIVNELLGEDLCKLIKLRSAQYFVVELENETCLPISTLVIGEKQYVLISKNFIESDKKYYYYSQLILSNGKPLNFYGDKNTYLKKLNKFRQFCKNDENFANFKEEMFKMLVLDMFMMQLDRRYKFNTMFEHNSNGEFHLAPILDSESSFDSDYIIYSHYNNFIGTIFFPTSELREFIYDSPNNVEVMKTFINLNADEFLEKFQSDRGIKFSLDEYSKKIKFFKTRQEIFCQCLKR